MITLTKKQKENLSKALFDISKIVLAILVLGNLVSEKSFSLPIFIGGMITFLLCFILAIIADS